MVMNEDAVRTRAYHIWECEGRPEGAEHAHWEQAVMELAHAGAVLGQAEIKATAGKMKKAAAPKSTAAKARSRKAA